MLEMKENARKSAHVFSKTKWKESWRNILREYTTSNKSEGEDSKQLTEVQRCIVELKDIANIEKKEIKDYLLNMLKNGWYMYVRCSGNGLKRFSYQRIQFIDTNEILYFTPEKTITEDDISVENLLKM